MTIDTNPSIQPAANVPANAPERGPGPARRPDEAPRDEAFVWLLGQFAQVATARASRNGSMSLDVGRAPEGDGNRAGAQGLPPKGVEGALSGANHDTRPAPRPRPSKAPGAPAGRDGNTARAGAGAGTPPRAGGESPAPSEPEGPGSPLYRKSAGASTPREGGPTNAEGARPGGDIAHAAGRASATRAGLPLARAEQTGVAALSRASGQAQPSGATAGPGSGARAPAASTAPQAQRAQAGPNRGDSQALLAGFRTQLAQGLGAALRQGRGEVTIKISPRTLGDVQVRIRVEQGAVTATIRPATVEARALLEQSVDSLRHTMEARGLTVGRIEIEPAPATREGQHHGAQTAQDAPDGRTAGQEGRPGGERRPAEPETGGRGAGRGPGDEAAPSEPEALHPRGRAGGPGVVYGVADGAARIVMVDALA